MINDREILANIPAHVQSTTHPKWTAIGLQFLSNFTKSFRQTLQLKTKGPYRATLHLVPKQSI
jgi:hypothetical protein